MLFPPYLARACCCVCYLRPGSCRVGSPCDPSVFGHKNTARFFVLRLWPSRDATTRTHARAPMDGVLCCRALPATWCPCFCSPCCVCVSALGLAGWAALGAPLPPTCPGCDTSVSCMVGVRRGVATSTDVWPAIPGLPDPTLRGLSGPASVRTGGRLRMIWSRRQAATCPGMIQSGGRRLLLLVPLRMIQSGLSGLFSLVNALVVLWPFLVVFPGNIQSTALHGLVSPSLHYHGLDHHHEPFLLAASLLLHGLVLLAVASHHHVLVFLFSAPHHRKTCPPHGCTSSRPPRRHLCFFAVPLPCPLGCFSASLQPHAQVFLSASPRLLPHLCCPASPRPRLHLLLHCISSALSFALPPDLTPSLHHNALGLVFPSPLAATFPWTLLPWGWGPLLVVPPQAILPSGLWLLLLVLPRLFLSGASARHVSLDYRVLGAVAPAA